MSYDPLHIRAQVNQAMADELARDNPREAVLACCALFTEVTERSVQRAAAIEKKKAGPDE